MQHYPHHIGDFDKATRHLTRLERSVYRDLMDLYYDTEKQLSLDIGYLCRRIVAPSIEESTAVEQVLNEFFIKTPTGWFHSRCDEVIENYHSNTSQKSRAGKASAEKRARKREQVLSGCSTGVENPLNESPTNQEPLTNNQEPLTKEDSADKSPPRGKPLRTLAGYIEDRKTQSLKIIPDDHAVFSYASQAGIPHEYLQLAWIEFKARYTAPPDDAKRYRDWGAVFLKAVKGNWLKVWYIEAGEYKLTTVGQQADMVRRRNGN